MEKFRPPDPLIFEGNLSDLWDRWKQQFELYLVATESHKKSEDIKTSILLTCVGKQGIEIYNTFTFTDEEDKLVLKSVLEKFEAYCKPRKNITLLRHNFLTHKQHDGVTFDAFVTELKRRSAQCEFGDLRESLIRDMIVIGVSDNSLRERLLRTETLTLENAIKIGQASEATKQQAMTLSRPHTGNQTNVDELRMKSNNIRRPRQQSTPNSASFQARTNCKYCGDNHQRGKCPAYGKTCSKCHKLNHFASVCLSTSRSVHYATEGHEGHDYVTANNIFIGTLSTEVKDNSINTANATQDGNRDWIISLRSNESVTEFKIDTGAQANVMPMTTIEKLANRPPIEKTNTTLTAYNGMNIPVIGKCTLDIQHNDNTHAIPFIVADTASPPLIGLRTSIDLNLIKRVWTVNAETPNFIHEYKDVFGELGCLKGEHHISIDPNVTPVVHPPRKIPISLLERLKTELARMCKLDVIEKIDEPTDWVSSMVVVEKDNGQLRICLDPKDLNTAIKRHHYPMPTVDEVLSKLGGATIFSKLDASSGYWQVKVDDYSAKLLAFNTPFGRYCFKRLAFGIHSAAEVFQKKVAEIIDGVPNAANDQDDIIVFGRNKEQHDKALKDILDRVRESGLKLNEKKCRFGVSETTFLGHVITAEGIKPDPRKIEAIISMPMPSNKAEVQRFLGMITYLGKFLPCLSDETAPLRQLLEKDVVWHFEERHRQAIEKLKRLVTRSPVLAYFEPNHATRITADASKSGLGAVLEQCEENIWKPVAYASRAMTPSEQNYAQIEKETLAIVFACERFHEYTYGRPITVRSDHKPLKAIFSKPLSKAPPRLQRLLLRLQRYELKVDYTPGTDIPVADALSRAYLENIATPEISEQDINCHVHSVLHNLPVSEAKLLEFKLETAKDPTLQKLKHIVINGLPSNKHLIADAVKPYLTYLDEISEAGGILLRGNRIITPSSMRREMKARIHEGHLGIERCKTRAREVLFWPGMATELTEMISRCEICLESRKRQQREPLMPLPPTHHAWSRVACDLFYMNGKDYLLIVDYHTSFPEVSLLSETNSAEIIKHTKSIFARHGIPDTVITDNGPQFASKEYREFAKQWEFQHITSSPIHPRSNGKVERTVQTVKTLLKKAIRSGEDPYLALLNFRACTSPDGTPAPAAMLMNRRLKTRLPSLEHREIPKKSSKQKLYYDRRTKGLPELSDGSNVRLHDGKGWRIKGQVIGKAETPRSYIVQTHSGGQLRRNRQDILLTPETAEKPQQDDEEEVEETHVQLSEPEDTGTTDDGNLSPPSYAYVTRYGRTVKPPTRFGQDT